MKVDGTRVFRIAITINNSTHHIHYNNNYITDTNTVRNTMLNSTHAHTNTCACITYTLYYGITYSYMYELT